LIVTQEVKIQTDPLPNAKPVYRASCIAPLPYRNVDFFSLTLGAFEQRANIQFCILNQSPANRELNRSFPNSPSLAKGQRQRYRIAILEMGRQVRMLLGTAFVRQTSMALDRTAWTGACWEPGIPA
jgi:hypothetical protein